MENQNLKQILIKTYGLFKITLGVGQIVGVFGSFFLLEFVVKYPSNVYVNVLSEETVALFYLAVLLRSIFHLTAGIGLARLKGWVRWLHIICWPISISLTYGMVIFLANKFENLQLVSNYVEIISPFKAALYLGFACFDLFYVNKYLKQKTLVVDKFDTDVDSQELNKILIFVVIVIVFFCGLLYLGKDIKQGFHSIYYKTEGKQGGQVSRKVLISSKKLIAESNHIDKGNKTNLRKQEQDISGKTDKVSLVVYSSDTGEKGYVYTSGENKNSVDASKKVNVVLYNTIVGSMAGILLLSSSLLYMSLRMGKKEFVKEELLLNALAMISFFFLTIYGLSLKLIPLYLAAFAVFIIYLVIIIYQIRTSK